MIMWQEKILTQMNICDTIKCTFTNEIVYIIVSYTNKNAKKMHDWYSCDNPTKKELSSKNENLTLFRSANNI